jgi:RHS repeat-associated protein
VGGTYARTGLPAALTSATYDDANQIATFGVTTFTYDDNGNLTSDGARSYTWNARNQLASLTGSVNGSFAYDGVGRRRSKTIGGTTTQFLYDGLNPLQELNGGTPTANLLTGLGIDEYFTRTDSAGVRNYLSDALGSSVALADGSGTIQTEYTYEPFGTTSVSGSSSSNSLAFTGREVDGTGLYYYRARYYHPSAQRFIGEDPLGFDGGDLNPHAYVSNAPTVLVDPTGELAWGAVAAAAIKCALGAGAAYGQARMQGRKPTWGDLAMGCLGRFGGGGAGQPNAARRGGGGGAGGARPSGPVRGRDAPGQTYNGQATDRFGNKLGPSGERQTNNTQSNPREGARNRALNEGSGATEHRNPRDGGPPHFHPTNNHGKKKPNSTHHQYPKK